MSYGRVSRRELMVYSACATACGLSVEGSEAAVAGIEIWPEHPRNVAAQLVAKYGPPQEQTASRLIWNANAPWKWSVLYAEEVQHKFPMPHVDVLEQAIPYKVPRDRCNDLARFCGSLIVRISKGELSAVCQGEALNFLAINLAHEIITKMRAVENARKFLLDTATAFHAGEKHPYTQGFVFNLPADDTTFPDGE